MTQAVHRLACRHRWALCLCAAMVIGSVLAAGSANAAARTVRVGIYENEPKIFTDQSGRPAGLFIDLIEKIAAREEWTLEYVPCAWEQCLAALEDGRIDLMPDVAFSLERERVFDFHRTQVVSSWSRIYARPGIRISSLADLNGRRVAVLGASIQQTEFGRNMRGFGFKLRLVLAKSLKEAFQRTADGAADVAIANQLFGEFFYRDYGLTATPIVFNLASLYYATAQGRNGDLLTAIDKNLNRWVAQPQSPYYTTLLRWTKERPVSSDRIPEFVYWLIGSTVGLLAAAFGVAFLLRRQVRSRTKHLERALETQRESEQRFRQLAEQWQTTFDATSDVIWVLDTEQRILRSNKAAERAFGCTAAEMIGKHNYEIALKASEPPPRSPFRRMLESLRRESLEMQIDERWFNVVVDPILDADKNLLGAVNILQDITESKRAEEQRERLEAELFQAQRIEAVGRLAGGVAHDFNNMLSIILGYGEMLLAKLEEQDPSRDDVKTMVEAGKRSAALTRQLLAFSRQQTLQPKMIDLKVILKDIEMMLRSLIGEEIELELIAPENLAPVIADPGQMEQVIMNLAINARDAMSKRGKLTIEALNVELDELFAMSHPGAVPGKFVMLAVTDTGCGMEKEVLDKIFEPFFTTKEKGKGTGLGLSTVYGIVKQSNGCIYAYSEPGEGSTFEVYLPQMEQRSDETGVLNRNEDQSGRGEHILLVEDEAALRALLEEMLVKLGYRVTVAANGNEAVLLVEERGLEPDLLLTDVVMPGMDGSVLVERLRERDPALNVLYMSGYMADAVSHDGILDPSTHFIEKPISLSDLSKSIREAMRGTAE